MLAANQQTISLGELKISVPHSFKYEILNTTELPISINQIRLGCGSCTKAAMNRSILTPGDSATLDVIFTPGATGLNTKNIMIDYEEGGVKMSEFVLNFKANVIP